MPIFSESIATRLKVARLALGWTAEQVGQRIGYAASTIASVENGHDKPGKRLKALLTDALKLNPIWLETGAGEMFQSDSSLPDPSSSGLAPMGLQPAGLAPTGISPSRLKRQSAADILKSDNKLQASPEFQRIEAFRVAGNLTWEEVSKELGLSVGMLMMVKSGKRRLSSKALYRLAEAEKRGGIDAYEALSIMELRQRPPDTDTGSMADFLRVDELPRYIAKCAADVEQQERFIALENEHLNLLKDFLHRAKMVLAHKLRGEKNLASNVAGNQPDKSSKPVEMEGEFTFRDIPASELPNVDPADEVQGSSVSPTQKSAIKAARALAESQTSKLKVNPAAKKKSPANVHLPSAVAGKSLGKPSDVRKNPS
jgi:transcriptional regulator with XRE-family HTH domain